VQPANARYAAALSVSNGHAANWKCETLLRLQRLLLHTRSLYRIDD
jgi:hypothetical protein